MLLATAKAGAQDSYNDRVKKYIDQYYPLAIAEQKNAGIPASITLGQGILETEAGTSDLMIMANNHFGIKCKNGWTGDTFIHTDDAPDECFKKYKCAEDSYKDHSAHLKRNPRYASLFSLSQTDYASWAIGLKRCGYATNPQYAQKLIKIIEDFKLQDYTYSALDSSLQVNYPTIPEATKTAAAIKNGTDISAVACTQPVVPVAITTPRPTVVTDTTQKNPKPDIAPLKSIADSARKRAIRTAAITPEAKKDTLKKLAPVAVTDIDGKYENGKIVMVNGMRAFYALKGEILLKYAVKNNVRYPRLLEMNDLPDAPLPFNMYIYLQKKPAYGIHVKHIVKEGETLLMISQEECIQLKKLMAFNYFNPHDEPATGAVLELQVMAERKPDTKFDRSTAHNTNTIVAGNDNDKQNDDYIALRKTGDDSTSGEENKLTNANEQAPGQQDTAKDDDLASLKAELDKVVYADDSKLPQTSAAAPVPKKHIEESAKPKPVEKKGAKTYKVKRGDTALGIARRNKITVRQLLKWNHIKDDDEIKAGQILRVK